MKTLIVDVLIGEFFVLFVGRSLVSVGDWFSGSARAGIVENVPVNVVTNSIHMISIVILRKNFAPCTL